MPHLKDKWCGRYAWKILNGGGVDIFVADDIVIDGIAGVIVVITIVLLIAMVQ